MFVGHYAVSYWAKAREPSVPLWVLMVAVQFVDVIWSFLVMGGIERVAMVPGITAASPLDLQYVPYTHSLTAAFGWSLLGFWVWFRIGQKQPGRARAAAFIGLAILSHWFADLLVHRPDLPLYGNAHKVGFGLWNYPAISYPLEIGLLGAAMWYWYRASGGRASKRNLLILWLVMVVSQAYVNFGPLPSSPSYFAIVALVSYFAFAVASRFCDAPPPPSTA